MLGGKSYNQFVNCARTIPGFIVGQKEDVPYDITELANNYCKAVDAKDVEGMSKYISALMIRYWHVVVMLYNTSQSARLDFDDIVSWVYEGFEKAFKYRSWLDSTKEVSKDPKGAEKCINQCITSVRQYWYRHFNHDKRKINYLISDSLDDIAPGPSYYEDNGVTLLDTIEDPDANKHDFSNLLVQSLLDKHKYAEALILDGILYQDVFTTKSTIEIITDEEGNEDEITHSKSSFSVMLLDRHMMQLDAAFREYFLNSYNVEDIEGLDKVIAEFNTCSPKKIKYIVRKYINNLQRSAEVKKFLCM